MYPDRSLEYQFAAASSREMMRDLIRVVSSPSAEALAKCRRFGVSLHLDGIMRVVFRLRTWWTPNVGTK
jgi:hypothetical protein